MKPVIECGYCSNRLRVRKDTKFGWDRIRCTCGAEFNWLSSPKDGRWEIMGIHDPPDNAIDPQTQV